jgi:hypothetical protein
MPRADQLPEDLKELAYRNGAELTHARWTSDLQLLIKALRPHVGELTTEPAAQSQPGAGATAVRMAPAPVVSAAPSLGVEATPTPPKKPLGLILGAVSGFPAETVLKQLGQVMIPAGLIALMCQLFRIDSQITALLSLSVVGEIAIWLNREHIQRRLSSPLLLSVLVLLLAGIPIYLHKLKTAKEISPPSELLGITAYGDRANDFLLPQVPAAINNAKEEIWFVGIDFHISVTQVQEELLSKLYQGVSVRFIIYDFLTGYSGSIASKAEFLQLAKTFDYDVDGMIADGESTVDNLLRLRKAWDQSRSAAKLEIRLTRTLPRARMYVFDPHREEGHSFIVPYIDYKNSVNNPGFIVLNRSQGFFGPYFKGSERIWASSEDFDSWLIKFTKYKKEGTIPAM